MDEYDSPEDVLRITDISELERITGIIQTELYKLGYENQNIHRKYEQQQDDDIALYESLSDAKQMDQGHPTSELYSEEDIETLNDNNEAIQWMMDFGNKLLQRKFELMKRYDLDRRVKQQNTPDKEIMKLLTRKAKTSPIVIEEDSESETEGSGRRSKRYRKRQRKRSKSKSRSRRSRKSSKKRKVKKGKRKSERAYYR